MTDADLLHLALGIAEWSQDPNTRVGAVIVSEGRIISNGWNSFPCGIEETSARLHDRETKLKLMVHAEMNAILSAARDGIRLKGTSLYLAATDDTGAIWGGCPCTRCTVEIIQAGITEIVSRPVKSGPSKWHADLAFARTLLNEAGVMYREVAL